jgi:hypothetical protein
MQARKTDSEDQTRAVVVYSDADERSAAEECVLTTHPGGKYSQSSDNRKNFFLPHFGNKTTRRVFCLTSVRAIRRKLADAQKERRRHTGVANKVAANVGQTLRNRNGDGWEHSGPGGGPRLA